MTVSVIWRVELLAQADVQTVAMPAGARILDARLQQRENQKLAFSLWFKCDPTKPIVARHFQIIATGEPFEDTGSRHVSTIVVPDTVGQSMVLHIFEMDPVRVA